MGRRTDTAADVGLLALRLTVGGLMAGHGAQKLFGSFGGPGLKGTAGWLESMGMKPGDRWALMAGGSEFGSGLLMATGFLNPIGPISLFGPMLMAWDKAHRGKPVWGQAGGPEPVLIYLAAATALAFTGPGSYSLDELFDIEVPMPLVVATAVGMAAGVVVGMMAQPDPPAPQDATPDEPPAGDGSGDHAA